MVRSGGLLGCSWDLLECSWALVGCTWGLFGCSCDSLGGSWGPVGVSWELLDAPSHVQVVEEDLLGVYKSWKETSYGANPHDSRATGLLNELLHIFPMVFHGFDHPPG